MLRFDKISHFLEYCLLGWLLIRALRKENPAKNLLILKCLAAGIAILYGASDEFHQSFVFGRSACVSDWIADSAGGAAGSFLWLK